MKKLSLLGMALLMCLSITACGQNQSSENNTEENETSTSEAVENNSENSESQQKVDGIRKYIRRRKCHAGRGKPSGAAKRADPAEDCAV